MVSEKLNPLDKVLLTPWLLAGLIAMLAVCWWSMPFNLFPGLQLAIPDYLNDSAEFRAHLQDSSLGMRLGFWIASKNWDAGPPGEYPYDFILFWHLALSALAYLGILSRVQVRIWRRIRHHKPARILSPGTLKTLFLYPLACTAIYCIFPWSAEDIAAHKVISLMVYPPFFCSLTLISLTSRNIWLSSPLIWVSCILVAMLSITGPFTGQGLDILIIWAITLFVSIWALVTSRAFIKRLRTI